MLAAIIAVAFSASVWTAAPASAIVNGDDVRAADFPFMVSVNNQDNVHFCGAALVAPSFVLTAAHCFGDDWARRPGPVSGEIAGIIRIAAGRDAPSQPGEPGLAADAAWIHPSIDAALIHLTLPTSQPGVPISYAPPAVGSSVRLLGYAGNTTCSGNGCRPVGLESADVTVKGSEFCRVDPGRPLIPRVNPSVCDYSSVMPVQGVNGQQAVRGDSGGPVVARRNNRWELVGVQGQVGPGTRTFVTRTSTLGVWLNQQMAQANRINVPPGAGARVTVLSTGRTPSNVSVNVGGRTHLLATDKIGNSVAVPTTVSGAMDVGIWIRSSPSRVMTTYNLPTVEPRYFHVQRDGPNSHVISFEEGADWTFGEPKLQVCVGSAPCGAPPGPASPPSVSTTVLPVATASTPYRAQLTGTGGSEPYSWSLTAGLLPPGITLVDTGVVSGTAVDSGSYAFTVQIRDGLGQTSSKNLTLDVTSPAALTFAPPTDTISLDYACGANETYQLTATGGMTPRTWSVVEGALPPYLALSSGGRLSVVGEPVGGAARSTFTVGVVDAAGATARGQISVFVGRCF